MAKSQLNATCPQNLEDRVERYQEAENIEYRSEAGRQLIERGLDDWEGPSPGDRLGQQATALAGVGTVVAAIAALLGQSWAVSVVIPFGTATFVFSILWASLRVLDGRDLV